ncbi:MAG: acyl-CoA thioesterase II [Gemmatimonadota bacterium]
MPTTVKKLIELLDLEVIEHNIYRGTNRDIGTGRIFGGQVLAQALVAARRTVEGDRPCHSMHGYFILEGDLSAPVVYFVDRLRDGRSYCTRRVTAIQHGEAIFNMSCSFHRPETGLEHQMAMRDTVGPESLRDELDVLREHAEQIPQRVRGVLTQDRVLDIRPVEAEDPFQPERRAPRQRYWMRTVNGLPDDPLLHQAILAYASDYGLLGAALRPHGVTFRDPEVMVASLDHAIWFHRPFRFDDWLLYVVESPSSGAGRGFSRGTFFTRDGTLVASVAQEGVLRVRRG